ncbi:MAG: DUF5615 family PIN-like protein [Cyclobacteriaceae bacterium]|nr:DUF5615 family PIN-like protein [Cyclobacteriaceae bacterium]
MAAYQLVADESVDYRIVISLRALGMTVYSISEQQPSIKDDTVLSIARENEALLLTEDKDFGELVFRLQLPHCGILLIRVDEAEQKIATTTEAIKKHYPEMKNKFSVINNRKLRIKE